MRSIISWDDYFGKQEESSYANPELIELLTALLSATRKVSKLFGRSDMTHKTTGTHQSKNVHGELQQKLDITANLTFIETMKAQKQICGIASEEEEFFLSFHNTGKYVLLLDPLDGSFNIDANCPIGTIFSLYHRITPVNTPVKLEDFLQPGNMQVAAGYAVYSTTTNFVFTMGRGVNGFMLDTENEEFFMTHPNLQIPKTGRVISINDMAYYYTDSSIRHYLNLVKEKSEKGVASLTSRYSGAVVADFHRTLIKGGICLYPKSKQFPKGKLRLLYECNPIAFISENAGGKASDGHQNILDITPNDLHQKSSFIVGSPITVNNVLAM